jgi:hypothetical protein
MLYVIAEAHSDYDMTPVEFKVSTDEKWFRCYVRPPYHIPATLGHVTKHYDCGFDDLYLHAPKGVDYIMSEGKYGSIDYEDGIFTEWNPEVGPWVVNDKWSDRGGWCKRITDIFLNKPEEFRPGRVKWTYEEK